MRFILFIILLLCISAGTALAQAPLGINYQFVVRDANSGILPNQNVSLRVSILEGSSNGNTIYQETHQVTTTDLGLANTVLGQGTTITGVFNSIDWGSNEYFVKTELDAAGGTNYQQMGTQQLMSVPYALHSEKADQLKNVDLNGANNGDVITYNAGTQVWEPGTASATVQGKTYLVISGETTDAEAATQIQQELGPSTQHIIVQNTTQLTTLSFPGITEVAYITISNNEALETVSFPDLENILLDLKVEQNEVLSSLLFPQIVSASNANIHYAPNLNQLSFPLLEKCYDNFSLVYCGITSFSLPNLEYGRSLGAIDCVSLSSFSCPSLITAGQVSIGSGGNASYPLSNVNLNSLESVDYLSIQYADQLSTLSLPSLTTSFTVEVYNCPVLTSVSLPLLETCYYLSIGNNAISAISLPQLFEATQLNFNGNSLSSISLPSLITMPAPNSNGQVQFTANSNQLNNNSVNQILAMLVSFNLTNGNISLQGQTPPAPPTGQGLIDKQTLIDNGCSVFTD